MEEIANETLSEIFHKFHSMYKSLSEKIDKELSQLLDAIKKFEKIKISSDDCRKQAQKFSAEVFDKKIKDFLEKVYKNA